MNEEYKEQTIVYVGIVEVEKNRIRHKYVKLPPGEDNDGRRLSWEREDELWYTKRLPTGFSPGSVLLAEMDEEDTVKGVKYTGFWANKEQAFEWQAEEQAIKTKVRTKKEAIKESSQNLVHEQLQPVQEAYKRMGAVQKRAFLAYMIEFITR